jgi:hypothetical protein
MKRLLLGLALATAALAHGPSTLPAGHIDLAVGPHPHLRPLSRGLLAQVSSAPVNGQPAPAPTGVTPAQLAAITTIPYFIDHFSYNGTGYGYAMPGTDPRTSPVSTTVRDEVIPLRFVFSNGTVFDPTPTVSALTGSPLFKPATFLSDSTQYGDAIQRAEVWNYVRGTSYHVRLATPVVSPVATVHVPAAYGHVGASHYGGTIGLIDETFFLKTIVPAVLTQLNVDPRMLAVLWSYNVDLSLPGGGAGAALGEHDAYAPSGSNDIWTWAWASWHTPNTAAAGSADVQPLSHELAEWYNDPFGINPVPPVADPGLGCSPLLEVGDPVIGHSFNVNGYDLQDEAFFSWFARQSPSVGINGLYDYMGVFTAPAPVCTQ